MAQNRKRPQYIEKQLQEINDILRAERLKYEDKYNNSLFTWFTQHLLHHGWYRGFNMHVDMEITDSRTGEKKIVRALAGQGYETMDYYLQIW